MDFIFDYVDETVFASILLFGLFFLMLAQGIAISVAIAVSSILTGLFFLPPSVAFFVATQKMFAGVDSFTLLAIPFFILAGNIMNKGGIAIRLVNLAKLIGGRLPGSLAHTNVIANMLFGSISGSAIAAAAAVGGTMAPLQKKEGYDPTFSAAVNIASAPSGILIPPSGPLILFSLVSGGTSISALFIGGYVPGLLMGLSVMIVAGIIAKRRKFPVSEIPGLGEAVKIVWQALPPLLMVVVVIGGIVIGAFTATEGAAVAVLYSFVLSLIYRLATWREYVDVLKSSMITSAVILFLIAASGVMSYVMTITGIPDAIADALLTFKNPIVILLIMNICLLIIGFFMDLTPAVLIFTPIFLPIAREVGMDPVQFGLMMIFNLGIGSMTPPVGSVLFVGCSIGGVSIEKVAKPLLPFFITLMIALLMITYIPALTTGLPRLLGLM
ncbi:TRAP transporter large permease [Martelella lutilitoris]|uniref:TRAP transporter large permease protein n=1 Tax=Martelella lutilitoris TaxID=2583532 RepID=A0A5C4JUC7_9HYPH|nr:TRAP transporter large permease [Martelella lutilitoris]TNB48887.1 TRAP transporter large permease [Martelella lutilitoris]